LRKPQVGYFDPERKMADSLDLIPAPRREAARMALTEVANGRDIAAMALLTGGASGALIYRVEVGAERVALRIEPERIALEHRRRGFACMEAAATVGVAPQVHFADPAAGIAVMGLIDARPIISHPGGRLGVAREFGRLIAQLQTTAPFPAMLGDDADMIVAALDALTNSGLFAAGTLDRHRDQLARIRGAAPWRPAALVSSHNDPNPRNLLYDGNRLWLVDWELASRNEALFDLAIATTEIADTLELETALLTAALGRTPDAALHARLRVMRQLTHLFYGCIALEAVAADRAKPDDGLGALSPAQFRAAATEGRFASDEIGHAFGKMSLRAFLDGCAAPDFEAALTLARSA
jgi:hypothetical protein